MKTLERPHRLLEHCAAVAHKHPLLVIRLVELGDLAWRQGRSEALRFEAECVHMLARRSAEFLRAGDLLFHEPGTGEILIFLCAPRDMRRRPAPVDARMILERLVAALKRERNMQLEHGWVMLDAKLDQDGLRRAVDRALEHGARERERYAFFSTIGHELRTPLTAVCGYLETLLEDDLTPRQRERFLQIAHTESRRASRLVNGMFDISLLDLQNREEADVACASEIALQAAVDAMRATPEGRLAVITTEFISEAPAGIAHDRLVQIMVNLLENALKYGRAPVHIRCASVIEHDNRLHITVEDNGPGIPAAERERVFGLGERAAGVIPGSGIGLAVVRLYAERAGGCVSCERSDLGGAAFHLRLPLLRGSRKIHEQ